MASTLAPDLRDLGPDRGPRAAATAPGRRTAAVVAVALAALVAALLRIRRGLGRLVAWFAADPQRVRAAATGLLVCVATGVVLGLGVGLAADATASFLLALVTGP